MKKCSRCSQIKDEKSFYKMSSSSNGLRPECKDCSKEWKRMKLKENPVEEKIKSLAHGIWARTITDINKPKNKCYLNKGIKCKIGNNRTEICKVLKDNFYEEIKVMIEKGEKPSVDRIDSDGHYEIGNIRIITLEENVRLGVANATKKCSKKILMVDTEGKETIFDSASDTSRRLGIKRDTVIRNAKNGTKTKNGLYFKYIS